MEEPATKIQVIDNPGIDRHCEYLDRLPSSPLLRKDKIHEKGQSLDQYGFTPTMAHQPVIYSYPVQCQPLGRQVSFNMRTIGAALPDMQYQGYANLSGPRCMVGSAQYPGQFLYHMPQLQQFPSPHPALPSPISNVSYYEALQAQLQNTYMIQPNASSNLSTRVNVGNYSFQSPAYNAQTQSSFFLQHTPYPVQNQQVNTDNQSTVVLPTKPVQSDSAQKSHSYPPGLSSGVQDKYKASANQSQPVAIRGPPRKPQQSSHAIWIGNLPPHTEIMSLVRHVYKETQGLESLFLISKSNCAFANFRDEDACATAQLKIHDSRFQTVRLVSRLRKSSSKTKSASITPTGSTTLAEPIAHSVTNPSLLPESQAETNAANTQSEANKETSVEINTIHKDRFFVVKSLTVEDLELSVKNKVWATQSHNEKVLNEAFKTSDNVFLIFSANKSGEYFGYAKMTSPINDDPAAMIEFASKAQAAKDPVPPKITLSPASGYTPKGRIIDDSTRSTIFWEIDREGEKDEDETDEIESNKSIPEEPPQILWGKPFEIEWISTVRLPFHRTRGLRNPWNSNREVKIARDGTELETGIGNRLIALFHKLPSPTPLPIPGMSLPMIGGYQQMNRFF
ncbi:putative rna- rbd [Erysiphe neolycopersici]|uniref:Putative rna-rbd n=1 Tax=Erysiphe neolycopersici TaxID=212602 RepID=A0A420I529_9PEZI|nr:putative rna- rbd [Erysiphe neolycopersici]